VTGLLESVVRRRESLSEQEQDAIASQIIATLEDEESWERYLDQNRDAFRSLAREAMEEHRRGETLPLDDLLVE
jgi:hypothetical protein